MLGPTSIAQFCIACKVSIAVAAQWHMHIQLLTQRQFGSCRQVSNDLHDFVKCSLARLSNMLCNSAVGIADIWPSGVTQPAYHTNCCDEPLLAVCTELLEVGDGSSKRHMHRDAIRHVQDDQHVLDIWFHAHIHMCLILVDGDTKIVNRMPRFEPLLWLAIKPLGKLRVKVVLVIFRADQHEVVDIQNQLKNDLVTTSFRVNSWRILPLHKAWTPLFFRRCHPVLESVLPTFRC